MSDPQDEAIRTLKNGDICGLEILVGIYQRRALLVAYQISGDVSTAKDIVADAFLAVYDHIDQFNERRPFQPWFYRIVINRALKACQKKRFLSSFSFDDHASRASAPVALHDDSSSWASTIAVFDAVSSLPQRLKTVVTLRYYLQMDEATMAATLACPVGTVKWRLHSARNRLRKMLAEDEAADIEGAYSRGGPI